MKPSPAHIAASVDERTDTHSIAFSCPRCRTTLNRVSRDQLKCPSDGTTFRREGGVWDMLPADRRAAYADFLRDYQCVRHAEGRSDIDPAALRRLPYEDPTGKFTRDWKVRAQSFETFTRNVLVPAEEARGSALRIVDLGAGNGWLSYRMAARGHHVFAVDLQADRHDGLRAHVHYDASFTPVRAEFDALPFHDGNFQLAVFNASFHYSTDYEKTLREAFRLLAPGGQCVILDTPIYREPGSGGQMVRERERAFLQQYGFPSNRLPSENFLTWGRIDELASILNINWRVIRPDYGLRWRLRPLVARIRARREPAQFALLVGRRNGPNLVGS